MNEIWQEVYGMQGELTKRRRDLHRYPESAWTEFRTASMVAKELTRLGYEVHLGKEVMDEKEMMGVPSVQILQSCMDRAINEGADPALVEKMSGGKTGVMGIMHFAKPGKVVGLRFDMDSNEVVESSDSTHRPMAENFRSTHEGCMHACGHDGHVTVGLAVAKLIAEHKAEMAGTVKFFFQPAEEGVRGARAMVASGIVDDVEYFLSGHIGFNADKDNELVCMTGGFLATSKLDAHFTGVSSHAGAAPEQGKNALLAAAQAAISLHTISRHGAGASRINVGVINAGTGRNILPDVGEIKMETRGANTDINDYMMNESKRMIAAAAAMYDVKVTTKEVGGAPACELSENMGKEIYNIATASGQFAEVVPFISLGASEDCSYFMDRVQRNGGQATYMMYGTTLKAGHHNMAFDFNEECLPKAVGILVTLAQYFGNK